MTKPTDCQRSLTLPLDFIRRQIIAELPACPADSEYRPKSRPMCLAVTEGGRIRSDRRLVCSYHGMPCIKLTKNQGTRTV